MLIGSGNKFTDSDLYSKPKPYCDCWQKQSPTKWKKRINTCEPCECGEENDVSEWKWELPGDCRSAVAVSEDKKQLTFHPYYSSGTVVVRGDTGLQRGSHYYWEVKMMTDAYGTDVMIGLGTDKVNTNSEFTFRSILGEDEESYGLSYRGTVHHDAKYSCDLPGFTKGSIVGVRVDLWHGTLEFYINRVPQGVSFYNLRRHQTLFPMVCSTAAQSVMRLTYAGSWRGSLLVDAAKVLARPASPAPTRRPPQRGAPASLRLPPGLRSLIRSQFWLTMPTLGGIGDDEPANTSLSADLESDNDSLIIQSPVGRGRRGRLFPESLPRDRRTKLFVIAAARVNSARAECERDDTDPWPIADYTNTVPLKRKRDE